MKTTALYRRLALTILLSFMGWGMSFYGGVAQPSTEQAAQTIAAALDVNGNRIIDDAEIKNAVRLWILGQPAPGTGLIEDATILRLMKMWITGETIAGEKPIGDTDWGAGDYWEFHATSTDGMDARIDYYVLGTTNLQGTEVWVIGRLLWDNQDDETLQEADVSFLAVDDLQIVNAAGEKLNLADALPSDVSIRKGGVETIALTVGSFQAQKETATSPEFEMSTWQVSQVAHPIKTVANMNGQRMTEELTLLEKKESVALRDEFFEELHSMLRSTERHIRVSGLHALALLGKFALKDQILEILADFTRNPERDISRAAQESLDFLRQEQFVFTDESSEGTTPSNSSSARPQPAIGPGVAAALEVIGHIANAFGLLGLSAGLDGGNTEVKILAPDCANPINLDVGAVVTAMPIHVDYSLGFFRKWGLMPGVLILLSATTYRYELEIIKNGISIVPQGFPQTGRSGLDMPPQVFQNALWAKTWDAQSGPSVEDVEIRAAIQLVTRPGLHPGQGIAPLSPWPAAEATCLLRFQVWNPFYVDPDTFRPEAEFRDHNHHNAEMQHRVQFEIKKDNNIHPTPTGWVIQPLENNGGDWAFEWRFSCDDPVSTCATHLPPTNPTGPSTVSDTTIIEGDVSRTKQNTVVVESLYRLVAVSTPGAHHTDSPTRFATQEHRESLDRQIDTELEVVALGDAASLGQWVAVSLLQGPLRTSPSLPIKGSYVDSDPCELGEQGVIPGEEHLHPMAQEECPLWLPPMIGFLAFWPEVAVGETAVGTIHFSDANGDVTGVSFQSESFPEGEISWNPNVFGQTEGEFQFELGCEELGLVQVLATLRDNEGHTSTGMQFSYNCVIPVNPSDPGSLDDQPLP